MNFQQMDQARREIEYDHYRRSGRFRAYCCGCISGESNSIIVCFCWAGISFYFAILAFMNKSPFYSYMKDVPLVAFGTINLLFGIVTFSSMVILLFRMMNVLRMQSVGLFKQLEKSKTTVFAITANALGVLIVTLANFILFIIEKGSFNDWCIGSSANYVKNVYIDYNPNSTVTTRTSLNSTLTDTTDVYNCERLFQDEVKWSLLCMVVMYVVYIHWILIIAARTSYNFYRQPAMLPITGEFVNVAPSKKHKNKINVFNNMKPAKSVWKELLAHKQFGEFEYGSVEIDPFEEPVKEKTTFDNRLSSNITLCNNSDNIAPPSNAFLTQSGTDVPHIPYHPDANISS